MMRRVAKRSWSKFCPGTFCVQCHCSAFSLCSTVVKELDAGMGVLGCLRLW
jgi:hypothetical protein